MLVMCQNLVFRPDDKGDDVPRAATERGNPGSHGETQRCERQR
jgi:hypothetical protein